MSIKQRRALVTGGAGGIGSAVAARLAATGASVVIADIDGERLNAVAADLAGTDADVEAVEVDVSDCAAVETMFAAYDGTGGIDILVATAAIVKPAPIIDFDPDDWARVIDINLTGTFHCCQFAARQMVRKGWGAPDHNQLDQRPDRQRQPGCLFLHEERRRPADPHVCQ